MDRFPDNLLGTDFPINKEDHVVMLTFESSPSITRAEDVYKLLIKNHDLIADDIIMERDEKACYIYFEDERQAHHAHVYLSRDYVDGITFGTRTRSEKATLGKGIYGVGQLPKNELPPDDEMSVDADDEEPPNDAMDEN